MSSGCKYCCAVIGGIKASVDSGDITSLAHYRVLFNDRTNSLVASCSSCPLSTREILEHIRHCCKYSDFLDALLAGFSIEDMCNSEEHCYFLFCAALVLESLYEESYVRIYNTLPFMRFSMRCRAYDDFFEQSTDCSPLRYPSYQLVSGEYVKFPSGMAPTPSDFMDMVFCQDTYPCYELMMPENAMLVEIRLDDIKRISAAGYCFPENITKLCKYLEPLSRVESWADVMKSYYSTDVGGIKYMYDSDDEEEDKKDMKDTKSFELYITCDISNINFLREADDDPDGKFLISPTLYNYTRDKLYPKYYRKYAGNEGFFGPCGVMRNMQGAQNANGVYDIDYSKDLEDIPVNEEEFLQILNGLANHGAPLFWNHTEIYFRKNSQAKSARK